MSHPLLLRRRALLAATVEHEFSPADISDLRVWYEADSLGLANGAEVTNWPDLSGFDSDLPAVSESSRPSYVTNAVNGHAAVEFFGNDGLERPNGSISDVTGRWTTFAVFLTDTVSGVHLLFNGDDGLSNQPPRQSQFMRINGTAFETVINGNTVDAAGVTLSTGTWYIGEVLREQTQAQTFINGVGNGATAATMVSEPSEGFDMGRFPTGFFWDGKIAEVIGYSRDLDSTERTAVRTYLATKYGITI